MPRKKDTDELVREMRKQLDEERAERERQHDELVRELRRGREDGPDGMETLRRGYSDSDPEAIRTDRQTRRKGGSR